MSSEKSRLPENQGAAHSTTPRQPECVTYRQISREANQILAELGGYVDTVTGTGSESATFADSIIRNAERLRILLRVSRVLIWTSLEEALWQDECRMEDIGLTMSSLFACSALQAEMTEATSRLPRPLQNLSERSRALFARAERLRSLEQTR